MTETARFESLIRGLIGPEGAARLVAALGLDVSTVRPDERGLERTGLAGVSSVSGSIRLGGRPGLTAFLVELDVDVTRTRLLAVARRIRSADPTGQHLVLVAGQAYRTVAVATFGLEGELRHLMLEPAAVRRTDVETLQDMVVSPGDGAVTIAARFAKALDRSRVTRRFFVDFRAQRSRIAAGWVGIPSSARHDREQLALLFLCRLMFLYFLQREGHLAGDEAYVPNLFTRWRRRRRTGRSFFRSRLDALFFGALNTRPAQRRSSARRLGDLPYLNGGLFERTALERRHPRLDLGDAIVAGVFDDLLERYRFDARDAAAAGIDGVASVDIDPEMLGRVFEGVMAAPRRGDTGTFFTPATAVDRLVRDTLSAHFGLVNGRAPDPRILRRTRVLDPACGSGAFLLGALSHLVALRQAAGEQEPAGIRRDIVSRCLHGVDTQSDAALLCALRLWLALSIADGTPGRIEPLPNLDRRIRQGDALLDPLDVLRRTDLMRGAPAAADVEVRAAARSLAPLTSRYVTAEPGERDRLQVGLLAGEAALARAWIAVADRTIACRIAELRTLAAQRDLWGRRDARSMAAASRADRLETDRRALRRVGLAIDGAAELPFFSFPVHFADAALDGFDVVLMNPPWVRAHRWPRQLRDLARKRYRVCREPGWPLGARLAGAPAAAGAQVDLALLFVERALGLLAPRGTLGTILPAKTFRSLYGGPARSMLLRETRIDRIDDHGLDHHAVFTADAFAGSVVATRTAVPVPPAVAPQVDEPRTGAVRIRLHRRMPPSLEFELPQHDLPLMSDDLRSPWLLAPPDVVRAFRLMQRAGHPLGRSCRVRRGIFTGANDVLLIREAAPRIAGLAWIRAEGRFSRRKQLRAPRTSAYEGLVESSALAPTLRGAGIDAWHFETTGFVIWSYDDTGRYHEPPARLAAWLERHSERLSRRSGRPGSTASLFRVSGDALGPKVVWHDLADRLEAVAVPATTRTRFGRYAPVVPLNTTYFIPVHDDAEARLLAGLLNSLPLRCFARAIAERAKDARFRFFAWTIAVLPLPPLGASPELERIASISEKAHEAGSIVDDRARELDSIVAGLYGLGPDELKALRRFDDWLSGHA